MSLLKPLVIAGTFILTAGLLGSALPLSIAGSRQSASIQITQQPHAAKAAETKPAEVVPTIEQILDKYVQAIGGKAAVQAATSRVVKGTLAAPAFGVKGTIEIYAKAPNKQLTEMAAPILGKSRVGFNGAIAWEEENGTVKDLPIYAKREADFYLPIKLRDLYPKIEFKGKEKIGKREVFHLEAPRGGNPKRWYFDVESGLLLRTEVRNAEGKLLNSEDYEDYRAVDGIQIPFTIRQVTGDGTEIVITLNSVTHNAPIDEAKFDKPPAKSAG
jgi:zinc protease